MKKQINYGITLCLLLLQLSAMAVNYTWVNWQATQDWSTPGNWNGDPSLEPTALDETHINQGPGVLGPIVNSNNAVTGRIVLDNGSSLTVAAGGFLDNSGQLVTGNGVSVGNTITVNGTLSVATQFGLGMNSGGDGTLTVNTGGIVNTPGSWLISGYGAGGSGDIIVDGGTLNATILYAGNFGDGTLTVNSGAANATSVLVVGLENSSTGHVTVNGGLLTVAGLNCGEKSGTAIVDLNGGQLINEGGFVQNANSVFNFSGGELVFTTSTLADVNWAIDNGGGTWNFTETRSVISNAQGIVVSSVPTPPTEAATIVSSSISNHVMRMVIDIPSGLNFYQPMASSNLVTEGWGSIPHSDDGVNPFVVTNLDYSTTDTSGSNEVIYVEVDHVQKFFSIEGMQP